MENAVNDRHGVLVGWTSQDLGEQVVLNIQTFDRKGWEDDDLPLLNTVLMTKSQAAMLANYLMNMIEPRQPRRRGWLASLFG